VSALSGISILGAEAETSASVPWQAHPEVWFLVVSAVALGWFASRVVQPKAIEAGYPPITRRQKTWFIVGVAGIWLASDWPVHDVAEDHLYFVHMFQHLVLSMLLPAAFVLATPRWLLELVIDPNGRVWHWFRKLSRPIVAGLIFNSLTVLLHWSAVVQWSADSGPAHFAFHLLIFGSGVLMWQPVIGPITEWRLAPLGQCIYLFIMSIVPTVPGGWLVFAEGVVYRHYDTAERLFGIDVLTDQQAAGVVMKLVGGFVLWAIIVTIFARWASSEAAKDRDARVERAAAARDTALTFESVQEVFDTTPAPAEQ
jgi:putative membrane protein